MGHIKRKVGFQPLFLQGHARFRWSNNDFCMTHDQHCHSTTCLQLFVMEKLIVLLPWLGFWVSHPNEVSGFAKFWICLGKWESSEPKEFLSASLKRIYKWTVLGDNILWTHQNFNTITITMTKGRTGYMLSESNDFLQNASHTKQLLWASNLPSYIHHWDSWFMGEGSFTIGKSSSALSQRFSMMQRYQA